MKHLSRAISENIEDSQSWAVRNSAPSGLKHGCTTAPVPPAKALGECNTSKLAASPL